MQSKQLSLHQTLSQFMSLTNYKPFASMWHTGAIISNPPVAAGHHSTVVVMATGAHKRPEGPCGVLSNLKVPPDSEACYAD